MGHVGTGGVPVVSRREAASLLGGDTLATLDTSNGVWAGSGAGGCPNMSQVSGSRYSLTMATSQPTQAHVGKVGTALAAVAELRHQQVAAYGQGSVAGLNRALVGLALGRQVPVIVATHGNAHLSRQPLAKAPRHGGQVVGIAGHHHRRAHGLMQG